MRQPTFSRSARARRQKRLLRTGIGIVVAIAVASLLANILGGDDTPEAQGPPPKVAFRTTAVAYADSGSLAKAAKVPAKRVKTERMAIKAMLTAWYEGTFVDASVFDVGAEGSFPSAELTSMFSDDARATLAADLDSLTLGSARGGFARVEPTSAQADLSFYFQRAKEPRLAVADVTFVATGTLKQEGAPVAIAQHAVFHFARSKGAWVIAFYETDEQQNSIQPSPSPSESS